MKFITISIFCFLRTQNLILVLSVSFSYTIFSQTQNELTYDSLKKENRTMHVIDFEYGAPGLTLGYNFQYKLNNRFNTGTRFGAIAYGFRKDRQPITTLSFEIEALISLKVWKTLHIEAMTGYNNLVGLSVILQNENCDQYGGSFCGKYGQGNIFFNCGFRAILFNHTFLRTGITLSKNLVYGDNFVFPKLAIGYMF